MIDIISRQLQCRAISPKLLAELEAATDDVLRYLRPGRGGHRAGSRET